LSPAIFFAIVVFGALLAVPAAAQHHGGHPAPAAQPHDPGHRGHGAAAGPEADGWSYLARDNPKPASRNRWVMVPGESGAMYRSAKDMSVAERCRALLGSPRIIVDEATRAACGGAGATPVPAGPAHIDHSRHR
jgi:hypothetical protein